MTVPSTRLRTGPRRRTIRATLPVDPPPQSTERPVVRRWLALVMLAGAWLVPVGANALSVGWLVPPAIIILVASLLRAGRTLLDRVILAVVLLIGAVCAAGLIFTVWPFGLSPVAAGGTALTVLVMFGVATGRRPALPRPSPADGLTVAAAAGVFLYVLRPYAATDSTGRLAILIAAEDHARHISLFDAVRRTGGYVFWHSPEAVPELYEKMRFYPHGWHLISGLLDGFVRSSALDLGSPASTVDHYVGYVLASYGLLALAVIWAAQWVAGPMLTAWRRLPLVTFLAAMLVYSDLFTLVVFGFVSEILGLTLLAVLVALLARGTSDIQHQMVLLGSLFVGIGFVYHLLLPVAALAVAIWGAGRRVDLRHHARLAAVVVLVAGSLACLSLGIGLVMSDHSKLLGADGSVPTNSRALLVSLALFVVAGLVATAGRRLRVWRSYRWTLVAAATLPAAVAAYQLDQIGRTSYYFEKALHAVLITLLVGLGALALLVPPPRRGPPPRQGLALRLPRRAPAALLAFSVAALLGAFFDDTPFQSTTSTPVTNWGRLWTSGRPAQINRPLALAVVNADRSLPHRPGTATVYVGTFDGLNDYRITLFLSVLQRSSGSTAEVLYNNGLIGVTTTERLEAVLLRSRLPVRVIAPTPRAVQAVREVQERHPSASIELVCLPKAALPG